MAKKSEVSNPTKSSTTRKLRVKDGTSGTSNDQSFPLTIEPEKHNKQFFLILIIATALISSLFTFGLANQLSPELAERTTLAAQTSGGVCLSEKELRTLITENKIVAYWTGPLKDATYSMPRHLAKYLSDISLREWTVEVPKQSSE